MNNTKTNHADHNAAAQWDLTRANIARVHLRLETLETRLSDSLDFYDLAVWDLRAALDAAHAAGFESAVQTHNPPTVDGFPVLRTTEAGPDGGSRKPW
jgi:hypothetical protein